VAGKDLALQVEYGLLRAAPLALEMTMDAIGTAAAKDHHHFRLGLPEGAAVWAFNDGVNARRSGAVLHSNPQRCCGAFRARHSEEV
jgi:hypothetical protein